ncbi:hypothetical protein I552_4811 [Mycobacterium xenopi 3993]|nr:hypothetical protein I552_4811 [Mycobacterium xenopi 3993]
MAAAVWQHQRVMRNDRKMTEIEAEVRPDESVWHPGDSARRLRPLQPQPSSRQSFPRTAI